MKAAAFLKAGLLASKSARDGRVVHLTKWKDCHHLPGGNDPQLWPGVVL